MASELTIPEGQTCTFFKHAREVGAPAPAVEAVGDPLHDVTIYLCAVCREILGEDLKKLAERHSQR